MVFNRKKKRCVPLPYFRVIPSSFIFGMKARMPPTSSSKENCPPKALRMANTPPVIMPFLFCAFFTFAKATIANIIAINEAIVKMMSNGKMIAPIKDAKPNVSHVEGEIRFQSISGHTPSNDGVPLLANAEKKASMKIMMKLISPNKTPVVRIRIKYMIATTIRKTSIPPK